MENLYSDPHHQTSPPPPSYNLIPPPDSVSHQLYWSQMQERRVLEYAIKSKLARSKRKMARQRAYFTKGSSSSGSSVTMEIRSISKPDDGSNGWFELGTPNNKRLMRVLLKKELQKSDVGSLGRIVLPKRETEENLPSLHDKEGIQITIRDIYTLREWVLKFKFWANNKSRMYVLEHTGEFVRENGLESGDSLFLYEDESKNLYYVIEKASKPEEVESLRTTDNGYKYNYQSSQPRDEDDAALALLIDQLKYKEQKEEEEARNLLGLLYASNTQTYGFNNNYTPQNPYHKQIE